MEINSGAEFLAVCVLLLVAAIICLPWGLVNYYNVDKPLIDASAGAQATCNVTRVGAVESTGYNYYYESWFDLSFVTIPDLCATVHKQKVPFTPEPISVGDEIPCWSTNFDDCDATVAAHQLTSMSSKSGWLIGVSSFIFGVFLALILVFCVSVACDYLTDYRHRRRTTAAIPAPPPSYGTATRKPPSYHSDL